MLHHGYRNVQDFEGNDGVVQNKLLAHFLGDRQHFHSLLLQNNFIPKEPVLSDFLNKINLRSKHCLIAPMIVWKRLLTLRPVNLPVDCFIFVVSNYMGFGLMDALKMVNFAKNWKSVPQQERCEIHRWLNSSIRLV